MVGIFATGKAKNAKIYNVLDPKLRDFEKALHNISLNLAKQIVVDGEGAKKFITINIIGARSVSMAKNVGFSIANSPLFKTAIAGEDPNWGRIVMAVGKSGEMVDRDTLYIGIGGHPVAHNGVAVDGYDETPVTDHMKNDEIDIFVDIGLGDGQFTIWTCDLSHGYISINADYRS